MDVSLKALLEKRGVCYVGSARSFKRFKELLDKSVQLIWSEGIGRAIGRNQHNVLVVGDETWTDTIGVAKKLQNIPFFKRTAFVRLIDGSCYWNGHSLETTSLTGHRFYIASFDDCQPGVDELRAFILRHNGQETKLAYPGSYSVVVGVPSTREQLTGLLKLRSIFRENTLSSSILPRVHTAEYSPLDFVCTRASPLEQFTLAVAISNEEIKASLSQAVRKLGGTLLAPFHEDICGCIIVTDQPSSQEYETIFTNLIRHNLIVSSEWVELMCTADGFEFMDPAGFVLNEALQRLPSSIGSFKGQRVYIDSMTVPGATDRVLSIVESLGGTITTMFADATLVVSDNVRKLAVELPMITRYCVFEIEKTMDAHICAAHHFPLRIEQGNESILKGKEFIVLLGLEEFAFYSSCIHAMGGSTSLNPSTSRLEQPSSFILTDGRYQKNILDKYASTIGKALYCMYILTVAGKTTDDVIGKFTYSPVSLSPRPPLAAEVHTVNRGDVCGSSGSGSMLPLRIPRFIPSSFSGLEFVLVDDCPVSHIRSSLLAHLCREFSKNELCLLSDSLAHHPLGGVDIAFGTMSLSSGEKSSATALLGILPSRSEQQARHFEQITDIACSLLASIGIEGTIVGGDDYRYVIMKVEDGAKQTTFLSAHTTEYNTTEYIEFSIAARALDEIGDDIALPRKVANPAVIVQCGTDCVCDSKSEIRDTLGAGITCQFVHEPKCQLLESGTPIVLRTDKSGVAYWRRGDGLCGRLSAITKTSVRRILDESDKFIASDLTIIDIYCPKCCPCHLIHCGRLSVVGAGVCVCGQSQDTFAIDHDQNG